MAKAGIPLTVSLTLLALSGVIDRFIIAHLIGSAQAGQYSAGVDLVRQALIIPAISAAAAFFPLAVQIHANNGVAAVRSHLAECFEFLLAGTLPACLGFAILSAHLANVILGADFRSTAIAVMPIVSIACAFQIMAYQYLHVSFLLSGRNSFYLWNTGSVLAFNTVVSYLLIQHFGSVGAAWGRLAAEIFGFSGALLLTRWAFPIPTPYRRLTKVLIASVAVSYTHLDVYKRQVRGFNAALKLGEDWEFWCRLAVLGDFAAMPDDIALQYRQRFNSANYRLRKSPARPNFAAIDAVFSNAAIQQKFLPAELKRLRRLAEIDAFWAGARNEYVQDRAIRFFEHVAIGAFLYPDSILKMCIRDRRCCKSRARFGS